MEVLDQLHRTIALKDIPKRIISLVPSQTELLCDLGLEDSLVGVTKFCVHPHHITTDVTVVGGTKNIHLDKIKALQPDIILCNKEENTKEIVDACERICPVHVSDIYTMADSMKLIEQYGVLFNRVKEAELMISQMKCEIGGFKSFLKDKKVLTVAYFIWKTPWMVAANNTFINHLLELNKFANAFEDNTRYPEVLTEESVHFENVDVVLLSSEPYPFKEIHKYEVQGYFPKAKIVLADGEMFSWYGSRLLKAFEYFKTLRLSLENNLAC
ncbi:ABC transporter substrate-binding protein [Aestuariibaculum suncheonense]|uniref:ABC transporter substrate-binding protein n=1 Tax=Aestuariibaculum suncheonense TaxID=1028745 RepID=A0A8J6QEE0_9FLAO|nr:helical backbone metal receptor [Aestuariibaculum suncheonense]MBD0834867.1 ABC transporter substrate-binding protein [Aestuariibaculum suncheonense]